MHKYGILLGMIDELRRAIPGEEFDYLSLMQALHEFERPRDKVSSLLRQRVIRRIKKGIYVFGEKLSRQPYSREVLANMIYGPSYVSLESALQHHGLIPEAVESVTSITCGRGRRFSTPVGVFTYRRIPMAAYCVGFDLIGLEAGRSFLMAVPEKALADKLRQDRGASIRNRKDMKGYLLTHLRINRDGLAEMDPALVAEIARRYRSRRLRILTSVIIGLKKES